MKITAKANELAAVVSRVSRFAALKGVHDIYESALLVATQDELSVSCTNLEVSSRVRVTAAVQIDSPGSATVNARRLSAALKGYGATEVTLSWDEGAQDLGIGPTGAEMSLSGPCPTDFPDVEIPATNGRLTLKAQDLSLLLSSVAYAAAKETLRFAMNGVMLIAEPHKLTAIATDGRRLAKGHVEADVDLQFKALVPTDLVTKLSLRGADTARIEIAGNFMRVCVAEDEIRSRLLAGSFPPTDDVIPKRGVCATFQRSGLQDVLERVKVVADAESYTARLAFGAEGLEVSARSKSGSLKESIAASVSSPAVVGLNPKLLGEVLSRVGTPEVGIGWAEVRPGSALDTPVRIDAGDFLHVIMPITVDP